MLYIIYYVYIYIYIYIYIYKFIKIIYTKIYQVAQNNQLSQSF